jgi:hypothetical protein
MSTKIDYRLTYWLNRYAQARFDHKGGQVEPEEFKRKIDEIEAECQEVFGSLDPFHNYLKLNYNHHDESFTFTEKTAF